MRKGNYGLDAPAVVIVYIAAGVVLVIAGTVLARRFYDASWMITLGILCLLVGFSMLYSSKVGKYRMREEIVRDLAIQGDETALDVGCGRGLLLNGVAAALTSGKAFGVDIWSLRDQSGNSRDAALENAKIEGTESKIEIVNTDMRILPFQDGFFDIIVSSLAIHNLKTKEDREKAVLEIARVAKPGCRVAIVDLANTALYADVLSGQGFSVERNRKHHFHMFPLERVVFAQKKMTGD